MRPNSLLQLQRFIRAKLPQNGSAKLDLIRSEYPQLRSTLVIVTYGRSGSTILQRLLQLLPDSVIRGENNHIIGPLYEAYAAAKIARIEYGASPQLDESPWYGADRIEPCEIGEWLAYAFVKNVLQPAKSAKYVGFKEIRWPQTENVLGLMEFMMAHLPNLYFILNSRHPSGLMQSSWWRTDPSMAQAEIERFEKIFADVERAFPGRTFRTQYEEFSKDSTALRGLFEMLGEQLDERRVEQLLARKLTH